VSWAGWCVLVAAAASGGDGGTRARPRAVDAGVACGADAGARSCAGGSAAPAAGFRADGTNTAGVLFTWDVPDLVQYIDVPGVTTSGEIPVKFNAAASRHDVGWLVQYYTQKFAAAGLYVPPDNEMPEFVGGSAQVTGLDVLSMTSHVVILKPIDATTTRVLIADAALQPLIDSAKGPSSPNDFAPLPASAQDVVRSSTEGTRLIQFSTPESPAEVEKFYREALTRTGYVVGKDQSCTRGSDSIHLWSQRRDGQTAVMLRHTPVSAPAGP